MEGSGQLHAPAALPPGKEPLIPIGEEASKTIRDQRFGSTKDEMMLFQLLKLQGVE
jgi:hypothetical protein